MTGSSCKTSGELGSALFDPLYQISSGFCNDTRLASFESIGLALAAEPHGEVKNEGGFKKMGRLGARVSLHGPRALDTHAALEAHVDR